MALHPTDEEDSKPEILKENHEDKRYRTGEYQPVSRRVDGSSHAVHHPLHVALPREDAFFGLRRMGNVGVDMFLFSAE